MTDYPVDKNMFLSPGFIWAREKVGLRNQQRRPWVIIQLKGKFPFLEGRVVFDPNNLDRKSPDYAPVNDPDKWEYGPEVQMPSNDFSTEEMDQ